YGDTRGPQVSWTDNRGFLDAPDNTNTGLTQLAARQYDPTLGRFISLDPLFEATDDQLLNGYTYTRDNPIGQADPTGLRPLGECDGACNTGASDVSKQEYVDARAAEDEADSNNSGSGSKSSSGNSAVTEAKSVVSKLSSDKLDWLRKHLAFYMKDPHWMDPGSGANNGIILSLDRAIHGSYSWKDLLKAFKGPLAGTAVAVIGTVLCPESAGVGCTVAVGAAAGLASQCVNDCDNAEALALAAAAGAATAYAGAKMNGLGAACNSFSADTKVLLANGKTKAIKDVKKGDAVEAADPDSGHHQGPRPVTATMVHHDNNLVDLTISTPDGHTSVLHTTTEHPFWDATFHGWVNAIDLVAGHRLATASGQSATVTAVEATPGVADRYNLTVEQLHTYYVLAGATPVLVHNSSCPSSIALGLTETDDNPFALADFADSTGAKMYSDWPQGQNWTTTVRQALDPKSGVQIHFNLDGIDDPAEFARPAEGLKDPEIGGYTAWELAQIKSAPASVQARVTWYSNGDVVPNPFGG
ncbi:polymorphic toxin-type HINT domain-containing protein, partial [Streptomyces sp. NPDC021224]|uniref:polymorphic toxin-type HINT domain-containing protein n=1 Tax=unclassified Streptomyces TaxID=2593676 RepID=UPI00378F132A